jgi:hypothetical protein
MPQPDRVPVAGIRGYELRGGNDLDAQIVAASVAASDQELAVL